MRTLQSKSFAQKLAKYLTILPFALLLITANSCAKKKEKVETPPTSVPPSLPAPSSVDIEDDEKGIDIADGPVVMRETIPGTDIYTSVDEYPQFPGGEEARTKFIKDNLKYPINAKKNGIQGRVTCSFTIEKNGSFSDIRVDRGIDPDLDKEAVRIIKAMPKWIPAKKGGKVVRMRYTLPIKFKLDSLKK